MTSSSSFPPAAGARIISLGGYQPANVVTNDDLSARLDTSDNLNINLQTALPTGSNTIGKVDVLGNAGAIMDFAGQNAASPANALLIGAQFNTAPTTITKLPTG